MKSLKKLEKIKENDMTNQRRFMDTQPIPVFEDATVLPTNPHQERQNHSLEGSSVTISIEERALHGTDQGVKHRCTSRPPKTFADLIKCGSSDEVRETLNAKGMLKEDNVVYTTQEDFQLPPLDH